MVQSVISIKERLLFHTGDMGLENGMIILKLYFVLTHTVSIFYLILNMGYSGSKMSPNPHLNGECL